MARAQRFQSLISTNSELLAFLNQNEKVLSGIEMMLLFAIKSAD